jgi:sigma-B regulation protein RsbQ
MPMSITSASVLERNHVTLAGRPSGRPIVFSHGFGCDQNVWRFVAPAFEPLYRVVLFDHVGSGSSDLAAYYPERYGSLGGYAGDLVDLCETLGVRDGVFVGHSVGAMIGLLASNAADVFSDLVLVGPSPRYVDDDGYRGGFSRADIDELIEAMDSNYLGWASAMAPLIMGNPDRPELGQDLTNSFCRTDPAIARQFARVTFLSDNRSDLAAVTARTLILQCADDVIAPTEVGDYVHSRIAGSTLVQMEATGHCPHLSAPGETIDAIERFLAATG